jgi:hypothetical protein
MRRGATDGSRRSPRASGAEGSVRALVLMLVIGLAGSAVLSVVLAQSRADGSAGDEDRALLDSLQQADARCGDPSEPKRQAQAVLPERPVK